MSDVELRAVVERKDASLPRYVVVPARAVAAWRLDGTTTVEGTLVGVPLGRRSLKRWDDRWFLDLPAPLCARAGVDVGDRVALVLRRASEVPPAELEHVLASSRVARERWDRMTASRQRLLREHVAAAKRPETRERRARKGLDLE
ncbi:MAG: YdeI/OmpD-associated family protein [Planctomycetota bacterium JB042]